MYEDFDWIDDIDGSAGIQERWREERKKLWDDIRAFYTLETVAECEQLRSRVDAARGRTQAFIAAGDHDRDRLRRAACWNWAGAALPAWGHG